MAMPHMAVDRLARELKKVRPVIPIILCTGYSDRMDEDKAKETVIRAYAMKPLEKKELSETVRKVLDESKN
jgi:response regulator RpfG family c-di-GMP phosphodiesterase